MSLLNRYLPLNTWYMNAMQMMADDQPHDDVEILSYHIPKCGGTSFVSSLREAYGRTHVIGLYHKSTIPAKLNNAAPVWLPQRIKVIHGMFQPHNRHIAQFPKAKRIIWIRDPLERLASLLQYWLRTDEPHDVEWMYFKRTYVQPNSQFPELFESLLADNNLTELKSTYSRIVESVGPDFFDFVGCIETYKEDFSRLDQLTARTMKPYHLNRKLTETPHFAPDQKRALAKEYESYHTLRLA